MGRQRFVLKRNALIKLLIGIIILSGCGQSENVKIDNNNLLTETVDSLVKEETDTKFTETEDETKGGNYNEPAKDLPKPPTVPVNIEAEDINYYMADDIDLLMALHRCESDGKNIYLAHSKPDLYVMPIGTNEHIPANIDNPEGMLVCNVALDTYGRIHLLMANHDYDEWFIWQLDESYHVEKKIDISAYSEPQQLPIWFLIDKDGTYYLQWIFERNGIIVDSEGILKHKFTLESLGVKWTYEAAVGKDGHIYLVHGSPDEKLEISKLDVKNCLIENENPALYFPGNEIFSEMYRGTDTNLLLYSPYSGVWACDTEKGIIENRVPLSDIGFDSDAEFWPLTFLRDGRLFLMGQAVNENNANVVDGEDFKPLLLKYLPVGK